MHAGIKFQCLKIDYIYINVLDFLNSLSFSLPHTDALNERAPVALRLINDSPQINGGTVSVDFSVSGPVNKVMCSLGQKLVEEDCKC